MKIGVIGCGAIGMIYAGLLSKRNKVYVFEKDLFTVNDIKWFKLNIQWKDIVDKYKVKPVISGFGKDVCDLVIISTKTMDMKEALEQNKNIIGPNTYLLGIQNGLGNKEILLNYVDEDHLILSVTKNNAIKLNKHQIKRTNLGSTCLGYNENNFNFVTDLGVEFNNCGLETTVTDKIDEAIWNKLFINIVENPLTVINKCTNGVIFCRKDIELVASALLKEAVEVANKSGMNFDYNAVYNQVKEHATSSFDGLPSMAQDINAHRKTEIHSLNGAVVELGEKLGVDVSFNNEIYKLIMAIEQK